MQSACTVLSTVVCPAVQNFFLSYLINGTIFGKMILDVKCVFWFTLQILSEIFLTLRIIQRYVLTSSCKVTVILGILNETWLLSWDLTHTPLGAVLFREDGGTDGQTDITKLIVSLSILRMHLTKLHSSHRVHLGVIQDYSNNCGGCNNLSYTIHLR